MPNRRSKSQFHGRIAALPEGVKQGGQGVSHGGLLNFAPSRQPVVFLKRKRRASFLSEGDANYPYGVSVLVRLRARYSGDRYRNIGRGAGEGAAGHRCRHLAAYSAAAAQQIRRYAEGVDSVRLGIGDEAALQMLGSARRLGQQDRELARRARFCRYNRELFVPRGVKDLTGEFAEMPGAVTVVR